MTARSCNGSSRLLSGSRTTRAAGALLVLVFAGAALHDVPAQACGWSGPTIEELTTFDPSVLGPEAMELAYNPFRAGFGEACTDCLTKALLDEWSAYFGGAVAVGQWELALFHSSVQDLEQLDAALVGKRAKPEGFDSLLAPAVRAKVRAALPLVKLARRVEAFAGAPTTEIVPANRRAAAAALLGELKAAGKAARAPFFAQRYAFLQLRMLFYSQRWDDVIATFDRDSAALLAPSQSLAWRARYYLAGALMRTAARGRANLELARVHAGYPPLAGAAANDFRPVEDADWRESLRLAKTPREKAELWNLVGLTRDGLVALREIVKLDASSPLLPALLVRELVRAESLTADPWGQGVDAKARERQRRDFATLEQLTLQVAQGKALRWKALLVAAHLSAKRGDVAATQSRLAAAQSDAPDHLNVQQQAKASLALALALDPNWQGRPSRETLAKRSTEIAEVMVALSPAFTCYAQVRSDVSSRLAKAHAASGNLVEAELLSPGFLAASDPSARHWRDPVFLQAMITRARAGTGPFDRWLRDSTKPESIERELALHHLANGAFAKAAALFASGRAAPQRLNTDPFVIHVRDCHDCDHERYADAPWTDASLAARLAELEKVARGTGEKAAIASLQLGNALYNLTWYGNARVVLADSHQKLRAPKAAERWYKRAYELSRQRERRAEAAFLAAKAELGSLLTAAEQAAGAGPSELVVDPLPVPTTWFPIVESYADTKYVRDVIAECSHFRAFTARDR